MCEGVPRCFWCVMGVVCARVCVCVQVAAIDDDAGLFGEVRYAILNTSAGASDFNIAMETGQVETAVRLDHETVSVYTLEIEAFDRDPNSLTRRLVAICV